MLDDAPHEVRAIIHAELDQAAEALHRLITQASSTELRRRSQGTRWTNQQLLFHMLFGYLLLVRLRVLMRVFGRLPDRAGRIFAKVLDAAATPFHVINYLGSWGGGTVLTPALIDTWMARTIRRLHRRLDAEFEADLQLRMHFPVGWDPYFTDTMTLAEYYRYTTRHFEHHRAQLTLDVDDS